jgi:DNA end-binding protein Ku
VGARSIWQGTLIVQKHQIGIKLYSAVVDRQTHFHLLHERDHARVQLRMVDEETDRPIPSPEMQKAFETKTGAYVVVTPEDLERSAPKPSREIEVSRFVPMNAVDPQFFERPYYLAPDGESTAGYFGLAQALENRKAAGIASWVMRKHSYVGALITYRRCLMLIALRHADEVIPVAQLDPPDGRPLEAKERNLADKLIEALSGQFDSSAYQDTYQERIRELIAAKRSGKKLKKKAVSRQRPAASLADSLESSLKTISVSRHA